MGPRNAGNAATEGINCSPSPWKKDQCTSCGSTKDLGKVLFSETWKILPKLNSHSCFFQHGCSFKTGPSSNTSTMLNLSSSSFIHFQCCWKVKPRWFSAGHRGNQGWNSQFIYDVPEKWHRSSSSSTGGEITTTCSTPWVSWRSRAWHPEGFSWNPWVLSQNFNPRKRQFQNGSETCAWSLCFPLLWKSRDGGVGFARTNPFAWHASRNHHGALLVSQKGD